LLSVAASAKEIVGADGCVDKTRFDKEWQRYSDIDERIPLQSRSAAAQDYQAALDEVREAHLEMARLQALMELDRQHRLAARDYRKALQQGHKANLIKTFIRMAWITYNTIGGPTGKREFVDAGADLAELLMNAGPNLPTLSRAVGVIKELVPKQYSSVPGESGKVVNVGVDAVLEGTKGVFDAPEKMAANVVAKIMETTGKEFLPSAELSDEEVDILRREHIELRHLDKALDQSYTLNKGRAAQIEALKAQMTEAQDKVKDAVKRERYRLLASLGQDCLKKPIKIDISAPAKVRLGESASLSAKVSGGSGEYTLLWFAAKPGPNGPRLDPNAHAEGGRTIQYRPGAVGPHVVVLQAYDKKLLDVTGSAGVLIEAVVPSAAPVAVAKPPAPAGNPDGLVFLEAHTVSPAKKAVTSFVAEAGVLYVLEVTGSMQTEYCTNWNGKFVRAREDARDNNLQVNNVSWTFLSTHRDGHVHQRRYPGSGTPLQLHYGSSHYRYINSSGTLTVKIYKVAPS